MRVALIGDVHANLPALEAVLGHARRHGAEAVWNIGDFVGYGAFPNQVIERLRQEQATSIAGNYDHRVLAFERKKGKWRKKKRPEKFLAFQWAHHVLTEGNRATLESLPGERDLQIESLRILLTHGSPASEDEHLTPDTPEGRLRELASMVAADVVIVGHSHRSFTRDVDGVRFINTGSVGRPDDGDPRACYAVMEIGLPPDRAPRVTHYRVAYDVERAVAAIREEGLPEAFAQMMIQGYALDDVMEAPEAWDTPDLDALPWDEAEREGRLEAVLQLAGSCDYEAPHTHHVVHLALRLFDELQPLHRLGAEERFWLRCGGLLHDIGWMEGRKGHHKASLRLILEGLNSSFDERERLMVGSIARYHRGAPPKEKHAHFAALSPVDQYRVTILAALLRVADGLDRTHRDVVEELSCDVSPRQIVVRCAVRMYPVPEREYALEKRDLLERAFDRELQVEWYVI
ncbi:MAG: YfcE family phosphodiesterase [Chloroflexota bacterium]|nr:YfcE family phosphodiesterase [Chloroflexota bacterium]